MESCETLNKSLIGRIKILISPVQILSMPAMSHKNPIKILMDPIISPGRDSWVPLGGLPGASWGLLGASWGLLGASWEPPGGLPGPPGGLLGGSGGASWASLGDLRRSTAQLKDRKSHENRKTLKVPYIWHFLWVPYP